MGAIQGVLAALRNRPALRIACIYAAVAGFWILASDTILGWLVRDPEALTRLAVAKGWAFVAATAALLYGLVSREIRRRSLVEADLRQSAAIQSLILENSGVGIAYVQQRRVIWANTRLAEMLDQPPEALAGASTRALYLDDEVFDRVGQEAYGTLEAGLWWDSEVPLRRRDGTRFEGRILGKALDPAQPHEGAVWIFEDITARKRGEEALRQSQKLEALGQLAGGVAHDTNNMLGVIIGYVDLLQDQVPEDALSDLAQIRKAALHSADLTRQLLAFARRQAIEPCGADLNALVESTQKMLRRLVGEQHGFEWKPGPDLWTVWVDPSQVDQILANLVVNARDALGEHGRITLATGNVQVDSSYLLAHPDAKPGEYVVLAVSDTGCGMAPEVQARIFDPFFTTKAMGRGTGLGLATVYGIVQQNGGFITVYSVVGTGTTFRVHLPRHLGEGEVHDRSEEVPVRGGTETLLLVEDEESLLELARRILETAGYRVLATSSPQEALGLLQAQEEGIGLLATDLMMPGLNGRELLVQLRNVQPGLKALFLSGYSEDLVSRDTCFEPGTGFLAKPFNRAGLLRKVREILEA